MKTLTSNTALKQESTFSQLDIENCQNSKFGLPHSLTSHKARAAVLEL